MWPEAAEIERVRRAIAEQSSSSAAAAGAAAEDHRNFFAVASPYRVCFLGAHVDHQGGSVTAMALDRGVLLGFSPLQTPQVILRSAQFPGEVSFQIPQVIKPNPDLVEKQLRDHSPSWGNYARGACYALLSRNHKLTRGILGYIEGWPGMHGCGVSSSAAVGVAFLLALEKANGIHLSPEENVELDRMIENEFLGLKNGILDPSAILFSRQGCLTLIRCKEGTHELVSLGPKRIEYRIILAFSGLRHALTSKAGFNLRVGECEEAAKVLLRAVGREWMKPALGNLSVDEYVVHRNTLEGSLLKRAQHFFTEKSRVEAGVRAWASGDLRAVGRLMTESGRSSVENYECGCEPLIQLWEILLEAPGVLGARFSGAGFRGCCVGIVEAGLAEEASVFVSRKYKECQPELWRNNSDAVLVCESGDSARFLTI